MEDGVGVMWGEGSWAGAGWCREGLRGLDLVLPRGLAELLPRSGTGFPRGCLPRPGRAPPTPAAPPSRPQGLSPLFALRTNGAPPASTFMMPGLSPGKRFGPQLSRARSRAPGPRPRPPGPQVLTERPRAPGGPGDGKRPPWAQPTAAGTRPRAPSRVRAGHPPSTATRPRGAAAATLRSPDIRRLSPAGSRSASERPALLSA